jgi:hypothetical protein
VPELKIIEGLAAPSGKRKKHEPRTVSGNGGIRLELIDCRPDLFEQLRTAGRPKRIGSVVLLIMLIGLVLAVLLLA